MEMKGSYKDRSSPNVCKSLVCDMEMKGSYKIPAYEGSCLPLVCDMEMKGSYKLRSLTLALLLACM